MSQVAGPYGLRVVKLLGDLPFSGGMHTFPLTTNQASGFFFGDVVALNAGQPTPIIASPTTTIGVNTPVGVFMGAEWQDPIRGFVNAQYLPANAITSGATKVKLKVCDYPHLVMQVQANGIITADKIGMNAVLVGPFSGGSTAVGNSVVAIDAASVGAGAAFALKIYDFVYTAAPSPGASSQPGDPFTDCLVIWNAGVHRWMNATGQ
jgi:hypothetical protein